MNQQTTATKQIHVYDCKRYLFILTSTEYFLLYFKKKIWSCSYSHWQTKPHSNHLKWIQIVNIHLQMYVNRGGGGYTCMSNVWTSYSLSYLVAALLLSLEPSDFPGFTIFPCNLPFFCFPPFLWPSSISSSLKAEI